jgi:uncharacterized protein (DUF2141 family)
MKSICLALLALLPLCSHAADLTLEVEGLDASRLEGSALMVAVYTEAGQWPGQPAVGRRFPLTVSAAGGRLTVVIQGAPDGPVALSAFHDVNGNGRLDRNPMGLPTEPYGFSNNASGNFGPPRFEQAVFTPEAGKPVRITLN